MTDVTLEAHIDVLIARAGLAMVDDDRERLIAIYPAILEQLSAMRALELESLEPAERFAP